MKCPNCGRLIRSKTQCAFCGCKFDSKELEEFNKRPEEEETYVPPHRSVTDEYGPSEDQEELDVYEEEEFIYTMPHLESDRPTSTEDHDATLVGYDFDRENTTFDEELYEDEVPIEDDLAGFGDSLYDEEADSSTYTPYPTEDVAYYEEKPRPRRGGFGSILWNLIKLILAVAIIFLLFLFGPDIYGKVMELFRPETSQVSEPPVTDDAEVTGEESEQNSVDEATTSTDESSTDESTEETSVAETTVASNGIGLTDSDVNTDAYPMIEVAMTVDGDLSELNGEDLSVSLDRDGEVTQFNEGYSLIREGDQLIFRFTDPQSNSFERSAVPSKLMVKSDRYDLDETIPFEIPASTLDPQLATDLEDILNETVARDADVSAVIYKPGEPTPFVYQDKAKEAGSMISWFVLARVYDQIDQGEIQLSDVVTIDEQLVGQNDGGELAVNGVGLEYTVEDLVYEVIANRDVTAMNHLIDLTGGPDDFSYWLNESGYFNTRLVEMINLDEEGHTRGAMTSAQDIATLLHRLANNELVSEELDQQFKEALLDSPVTDKFPYDTLAAALRRYELSTGDDNEFEQHYAGIIETESGDYIVSILATNYQDAYETVQSIALAVNDLVETSLTGTRPEEQEVTEAEEVVEVTEAEVAAPLETTAETGSQYIYGPDEDGDGRPDSYQNESGVYVPIRWFQGEDGNWYFID